MSSTSLDRKSFSRRSFFSAAAGAAGALTALKATVASAATSRWKKSETPAVDAPTPAMAPPAALQTNAREVLESSRFVDASTLQPANDEVLRAVGAIKPGTDVYGWKVVAVYGVHLGAIPVIMQDKSGGRFQVDVCARDAAGPKAVKSTKALSLYLANGGDGRHPSDESHGLGAMALGTWLSRKRGAGFRPAGLLTLSERNAAHPHGAFNVSV